MDEPNQTTEETPQTVETTEEPTTTTEETQGSPPWGEDFDPSRAWNTIQTLRDEVKEFKQGSQEREQARQEAQAWQILAASEDDDQIQAAADFLGVELESDHTDEGEFEDPYEPRLSRLEQQQQQQLEQENMRAFNSHVDELAKGSDVKLSQRDRNILLSASHEYGFNPDATEQAFKEFLDERKAYDKAVIDGYVQSKNAPHVSSVGGPQSTEDVLPDDATPQERQRWMTERYQMGQRQ